MLAATPGSIKQILIGTTSSGISYQLRDIYSICRCCWNVATYEWKVHNGKIEIIAFLENYEQQSINHKLLIEHARWNNIPRENRKGTLYNLEEIDDEFHYTLNSPYFKQYIYIYIYVWKLNQTVLELDFRAVKFLFFPRRDLNPHHCYTAAPFA